MRRAYRFSVGVVIGAWTLAVFPTSLLATVVTGSGHAGHRFHARFWGRAILATCGVRLRVHHGERVLRAHPAILMINHGSLFSAFAVAAAFPIQWRAVLDWRWRRIPVFGWIGRMAGHVFLDRSKSDRAIERLNREAARVRDGISVVVFPEGVYADTDELLPFRKGGFHLAVRAGRPIVPLTAVETTTAGPARAVRAIDLHVGEPVPTEGLGPDDIPVLVERVRAAIRRPLEGPAVRPREEVHEPEESGHPTRCGGKRGT